MRDIQRDNVNEYVWTSKGISSAVVLTKGIKNILKHKNTTTVVNKRIYGNGFNPRIVRKILDINSDKKIDLIITADHGSNDDEYYIELKNKNVSFITQFLINFLLTPKYTKVLRKCKFFW